MAAVPRRRSRASRDCGATAVLSPPRDGLLNDVAIPVRTLYYALGGGLGHLVRARAFLRTQGLDAGAVVLSASSHVEDTRVLSGIEGRRVPSELERDAGAFRDWLAREIATMQPELVCIDAFPGGILGELCGFAPLAGTRLWHIARLLRWDVYAPELTGPLPRYERTWRLEPLHEEHDRRLQACSEEIVDCILPDDDDTPEPAPPATPYWLVVHSGPAPEVGELIAYAIERRALSRSSAHLIVATMSPPADLPASCRVLDRFPASGLYAGAERIVTAAGYNVMRETAPHRHKQLVLPFPRRYDDQFERARRARSGLAGG